MSTMWNIVICLALLAVWRVAFHPEEITVETPPDAGPKAAGSDASAVGCLLLAREAGGRAAAGNFVISPLLIHAALALVAAGTRGDTQRELLRFLGSPSLDDLHGAAATGLVGKLNGLPQTSFACGVWVDQRRTLRLEFAAAAYSRYGAGAESVDFVSGAEQARRRVNDFVADATRDLVGDVLPPGSVDANTAVVVANAIYFKGAWSHAFDRSVTAPFHTPDGAIVRVPFMTAGRSQHVAVYPSFKALKLPYKVDSDDVRQEAEFYMLLLLPDIDTPNLADLYDKVVSTPEFIKNHTPAAEVPVGRFMVPKFKFTFELEASSDMRKLGVTRAFHGGDFSGMVSDTGDGPLFISGVYHKATIEVDELGTVAAAATAVSINVGSAWGREPRPLVDFVADRPFLFAIVEEKTSAVLFLGHVVNPLAN